MKTLETLEFINRYSRLPQEFYSRQAVAPLAGLRWLTGSPAAAALLDLDVEQFKRRDIADVIGGSASWVGTSPLAMVYSGHQFGGYTPRLGDGRGLLLGEVQNTKGEVWDVHLKGAGPTPYSRMGDGRAVLRSSIREYLCSESLAALGVPTTRALGLLGSDEPVYRETEERGAMLIRIAKTHVRFGHFEYFYYSQQHELLKQLAEFCLETYFTHCTSLVLPYEAMFAGIVERTAKMIAYWQAYGFCHGVMNTDNFSILGDTFDFGPFAFLDDYDPRFICNHSDSQGRYAFYRQPSIAYWNLQCLAQALTPIIEMEGLRKGLESFEPVLVKEFSELMRRRLGLPEFTESDHEMLKVWLQLLATNKMDYTLAFRWLGEVRPGRQPEKLRNEFMQLPEFDAWLEQYQCRLKGQDWDQRQQLMNAVNPHYVMRNYLLQEAIEKAEAGDISEVERLFLIMQSPFDEQPEFLKYAKRPPQWGKSLEISCSS